MSQATRAPKILSNSQVIEIFELKSSPSTVRNTRKGWIPSSALAKRFGVTSKTIRDIWMGRTWYRVTHHLDPSRFDSIERFSRKVGRPKGSKDSKPRFRQSQSRAAKRAVTIKNAESNVNEYKGGGCNEVKSQDEEKTDYSKNKKSVCQNIDDSNHCKRCVEDFADPFHDDWAHWDGVSLKEEDE